MGDKASIFVLFKLVLLLLCCVFRVLIKMAYDRFEIQ